MPTVPKNIVICSDGTGNSYEGTESNVLRLYQLALNRSPHQLACYDPGVGTHPLPTGRTRLGRWVQHCGEIFLGHGVIENVSHLYLALMKHYEPGDRIFLFGFSRGAFTVRALAGLIHVCGLLHWDDAHLVRYATGLYQTSEGRIKKAQWCPKETDPAAPVDNAKSDEQAKRFKALLSRDCQIAFMGIWDTVKAYGWMWPKSFPALRHNPSVAAVRHAVALDERRAVFQMTGWGDRHEDVKEVWFAGDHSDVGGGHPINSALSDAALRWMLGEAIHAGLLIDPARLATVDSIDKNSRYASCTKPNDLVRDHYYYKIPLPRAELDNSSYPPKRNFRIWPVGVRKPAAHTENRPLLFHRTVREREQRDPGYLENLLGGKRGVRGVLPSEIVAEYEDDRESAGDRWPLPVLDRSASSPA